MKIKPIKITIKELIHDYINCEDEGVTAYGGKLNIRPKYQREFIYSPEKQKAVIGTVLKGFPLNTMYWVKNQEGDFEILDGQQRTMSICEYCKNAFSWNEKFFSNLAKDIQNNLLNYELTIYVCEGTDSERLEWFKTINIAGVPLTIQELRNANYTGTWLTSAKAYFSKKNNCPAENRFGDYLTGDRSRQVYLETVLSWLVDYLGRTGGDPISEYMGKHQNDTDASELINYFDSVQKWVHSTFIKYRKEMKGLPWGMYFNKYGKNKLDSQQVEKKIAELMKDPEIRNKKGIYEYILTGEIKSLNLREFDDSLKRTLYERQNGICPICKKHFEISEMDAHHIKQWIDGGRTEIDNGVMLCRSCHHNKLFKLHHK